MEDKSKRLLAGLFSVMFLSVTACLAAMSLVEFVLAFSQAQENNLISGIVRAINTAIIALATFELGVGIGKEYTLPDEGGDLYPVVRRSVTRFVSVVCIALVLESLIMVIKYSQLELAGNLFYPVAVVGGASLLLLALGLFIHLTRLDALGATQMKPAQARLVPGTESARGADFALFGLAPEPARAPIRS